ncbi:MAG: FtsX-like permease family protein, partial [Nitrospirae bacterium]
ITNTMTTLIFERFREFGTLTAIGTPPEGIVTMVLSESALLGIIACVIGTLTGYLVCLYLRQHGIDLNQFTSANQHMAFSHVLKAYALPGDIIKADVITFLTALVAGLYPSLKAARLNPVDALRHV